MKNEDQKASVYTMIYWLIQDKKIEPDYLLNLVELYWPTFITKDQFVFLQENFSEIEYQQLLEKKSNPEYWINLLTVDDFFSETPDEAKQSKKLSETLKEIWEVKLKNDFPSLVFTVELLQDEEQGDYGLTFYQTLNKSFIN